MAVPKVFVSHNHTDNAYCRDFVATLRQSIGSDEVIWYDEHNLGWGKIRREIERELTQRQHFIAILSPAAVKSDWVNDEIDAAIELRRRGSMQTIQFVVALSCDMPLLLSNYKRVVTAEGQPYTPQEAASRALAVIQLVSSNTTSATPTAPQLQAQAQVIPSDRFPKRLADLGFTAYSTDGVEYIVPPICRIPAGPFLMGTDPTLDTDEQIDEHLQHSETLPAYEIARCPVTVAEYACFVRFGQREPLSVSGRNQVDWHTQLGRLDHPIVCVNWHDAAAYASWLSDRTGDVWRLPSEAEWEKAARGTDGRIYPWGNTFDMSRCNTQASGINTTSPVGSYASGESPYGVQDMAGNVWEWTGSRKSSASGDDQHDTYPGFAVIRGGAWNGAALSTRVVHTFQDRLSMFDDCTGFRLVRAAP